MSAPGRTRIFISPLPSAISTPISAFSESAESSMVIFQAPATNHRPVKPVYLQDPDGNWIEINDAGHPPW